MKVVEIRKFQVPGLCTLEFVPVGDVPGHSHRVVVDGQAQKLWLPDDKRPNKKNAIFFVRVWAALRDGLSKYHYADAEIDPPLSAGLSVTPVMQ